MWVHGSRRIRKPKPQNSLSTVLVRLAQLCLLFVNNLARFLGQKDAPVCDLPSRSLSLLLSLPLPALFNIVFHLISALSDALTVNVTCACSICNTFFLLFFALWPQICCVSVVICTVLGKKHATTAMQSYVIPL